MRECPFAGCGKPIPDAVFACRRHWFSIPPLTRLVIHRAYADYMADRIGVEELRAVQQRVLDGTPPGGTA